MPHTRKYFCSLAKDARRTRPVTCGFKAGQSPRGRIAWRVECAQTIAAGMSAIEPTVVVSREGGVQLSPSPVIGDIIADNRTPPKKVKLPIDGIGRI